MSDVYLSPTGVPVIRFSHLPGPSQVLVRLFQSINFGQILNLSVLDGKPVYDPEPVILVDVKLDAEEAARPESELADFELRAEVRRFLHHLHRIKNGRIEKIEVRSGIPWRITMQRKVTGTPQ